MKLNSIIRVSESSVKEIYFVNDGTVVLCENNNSIFNGTVEINKLVYPTVESYFSSKTYADEVKILVYSSTIPGDKMLYAALCIGSHVNLVAGLQYGYSFVPVYTGTLEESDFEALQTKLINSFETARVYESRKVPAVNPLDYLLKNMYL